MVTAVRRAHMCTSYTIQLLLLLMCHHCLLMKHSLVDQLSSHALVLGLHCHKSPGLMKALRLKLAPLAMVRMYVHTFRTVDLSIITVVVYYQLVVKVIHVHLLVKGLEHTASQ